ncbi:MAG TPA: inositol monophosphatase family protein [Beijerinckiaceae bacterium]|nr:inositol monophosphatase family protein [Beijerinckiaceae bacterium]
MINSPTINVMTAAALKAGRSLRNDFGRLPSLAVARKGPGDFVSQADKKAEDILYAELEKARPGYSFRMEESGVREGVDKTHCWHVDPLDGTTNFLHGIPQFAVSIGLEREGALVAGVIYNPITDDLYVAEKGQGAFHNNRRMRVSACIEPADALIAIGIPHIGKAGAPQFLKELAATMARFGGHRRMGAAALDLAGVAAGQYEAFYERGLNSWDIAAGIVLVREAGGFVSDLTGGNRFLETGGLVAGNEAIQRELVSVLTRLG